ncbi:MULTISPECIES: Ig-like domain-containing protein [unclassified Streptomyces]|uniref:L,D-transpeptidase n=1 Tax=unclassified Streptomyces TaxID=2593676 RepID=UPI00081DBCA7|nr:MULTISPECIES: Ig-like domain-containing protein [unclassified Streptomyces]MYZ39059.1 L,D-transpeptidase family protein [Streptomyces sp. SID4917]SCG01913.1 Lipoprotein-anchoring transpeptidase ErfK/SrfK [Streptomyces sp. MnatMP-M17]
MVVALAWTGLLAGLTGCTGQRPPVNDAKPRPPGDTIRITPKDGAKNIGAAEKIEVSVADGRLERVRVVQIEDASPTAVPGRISKDGRVWTPAGRARIALAAKYSIDAVAVDGRGRRSARHTTFTTAVPTDQFTGYFSPENRATVGTGMIISFDFNRKIRNRAAVERAIEVTSDPPVEVSGHWFGDQRLDFRPRTYWKPGTEVAIRIGLRDVQAAPGVFGIQNKHVGFRVARSQISRVDARKHTMEVRRDGMLLSTLPITAGAPKNPTYNGKMVVTELYDVTRMNGETVGFGGEYDIEDVPHALRLTTSGTFLHGNYWASEETFGAENVSHGCVGLRDVRGGAPDTPAGWFFYQTLIGDVVEVVNSHDRTVAPDNGLGGWNLSWQRWKEGSAVH